jgi:uncharacterized protein YeaO (DUF488 family)
MSRLKEIQSTLDRLGMPKESFKLFAEYYNKKLNKNKKKVNKLIFILSDEDSEYLEFLANDSYTSKAHSLRKLIRNTRSKDKRFKEYRHLTFGTKNGITFKQ